MNNLYNTLLNDGGFSVNSKLESPDNGFMVAYQNAETICPVEMLDEQFFNQLSDVYMKRIADDYFGAWVDNGKVYFDISQNVADKETAINVGKEREQLAIFDLSDYSTYPIAA